MKVLNVGGGNRNLPANYAGWEQKLLDIDPATEPDYRCSATDIIRWTDNREMFDAVYSSHCLEHFYKHDVDRVLKGFLHVLNEDGFAEISVPNLSGLFAELRARNHDINDVWYRTGSGAPVTFHDVLYGWDIAMSNGNLYYAHKCGFTPASLNAALTTAGFGSVWVADQGMNLHAIAYKKEGIPCP